MTYETDWNGNESPWSISEATRHYMQTVGDCDHLAQLKLMETFHQRKLKDAELIDRWYRYSAPTLNALEARVRRIAKKLDYELRKVNGRSLRFDSPSWYRLWDIHLDEYWFRQGEPARLHEILNFLLNEEQREKEERSQANEPEPANVDISDVEAMVWL